MRDLQEFWGVVCLPLAVSAWKHSLGSLHL